MPEWWTIGIAAYAAVVASGALALEVRRWFESGVRLSIRTMPEAKTINLGEMENNTYLLTIVKNRGTASTTITHLGFFQYGSWLSRLRNRARWSAIVKPGTYTPLPAILPPGEVWQGLALHDNEFVDRILAGRLYVAIYASHSDKPFLKRVRLAAKPPKAADELASQEAAQPPQTALERLHSGTRS